MGLYVNPIDDFGRPSAKKNWLRRVGGERVSLVDVPAQYDALLARGMIPVVWVDNGYFEAIAVAYSREECVYLCSVTDSDNRPKMAYIVKLADLNYRAGIDPAELQSCGLAE